MKKIRKILAILLVTFCVAISLFIFTVIFISPVVNDSYAKKTAKTIRSIELPKDTEYVEMFSKSGKLIGNGNGIQYFGGILVKSNLSLEELQDYYSDKVEKKLDCFVERQTGSELNCLEHYNIKLKEDITGEGYYIVCAWGDYNNFFTNFDLRGN